MPILKLFKMMRPKRPTIGQRIRRFFIYIFLVLASVLFTYFFIGHPKPADSISWGVTFSKAHTEYLGLDWKKTYNAIIDDLNVTHIRIAIPWNDIEAKIDQYTLDNYHYMLRKAQNSGVAVIPVIGLRTPRWPECHAPDWYFHLPKKEKDEQLLELIDVIVSEFKLYHTITAWQVENEPFVRVFGECPKISPELLGREIERVKALDNRPIIVTDSGELGIWSTKLNQADILGVTMYRWVWNDHLNYLKYPWTPQFYARRAELVKKSNPDARIIGSELQMEPWINGSIHDVPLEEQFKTMNPEQFTENVEFARNSGFDEHYLWGVEWWYWMKEVKSDSRFWNEAKKLWN